MVPQSDLHRGPFRGHGGGSVRHHMAPIVDYGRVRKPLTS